jgi:hypothetical protein
MKVACAAILVLLAFPATAWGAEPTITSRDVPLGSGRTLASAGTPRFNVVGLHWQGGGTVTFRTRGVSGGWSPWRPAAPEDEDRPDAGAGERTVAGWNIGNPYWTGASDRVEVRTRGPVRRVRAHYVWSPVRAVPARTVSLAASPAIIPRLSWDANESIRRAAPSYAPAVRLALVHHTAGSNSYTPAQSAAIVRAIQVYHVKGNGWNDVGYNFLVDKYGQVFEGRYGGMTRNVVGAHAEGFNTGSVGVAVLGNYTGTGITQAARDAVVQLVAWRLDVAHLDPLSTLSFISGGTRKFPRGVPVFLRAVAGHRDVGLTSCPGDRLYAELNALAGSISQTGLPKLYEPSASGRIGGPVRFRGRLSAPIPWTVTVTDAAGNRVGAGWGTGMTVDWTWDATGAPPGRYSWAIEAGRDVLPATGTIGGRSAVLAVTGGRAEPGVVSPNGDGFADSTAVSYTLTAPATVTATLTDAGGTPLSTLFSEPRAAGRQEFVFTGDTLGDGAYAIVLTAVGANGRQVTAQVPVVVNRTLGYLGAEAAVFSPNGDGRLDAIEFRFLLAAGSEVKVRVLRDGKWVATPFAGPLEAGDHRVSYDGAKRIGRLRDGAYELEVSAATPLGAIAQRAPFASDTVPPKVTLLSTRPLQIRVGEPARVSVWVNGQRRTFERKREGSMWLKAPRTLRTLRIVAWDAAGNRSTPIIRRR